MKTKIIPKLRGLKSERSVCAPVGWWGHKMFYSRVYYIVEEHHFCGYLFIAFCQTGWENCNLFHLPVMNLRRSHCTANAWRIYEYRCSSPQEISAQTINGPLLTSCLISWSQILAPCPTHLSIYIWNKLQGLQQWWKLPFSLVWWAWIISYLQRATTHVII